jgi:dihydroxy-acid dehydratase
MPELLGPTGAMIGAGLAQTCCLLTDGRFSGASRGFIIVRPPPPFPRHFSLTLVERRVTLHLKRTTEDL